MNLDRSEDSRRRTGRAWAAKVAVLALASWAAIATALCVVMFSDARLATASSRACVWTRLAAVRAVERRALGPPRAGWRRVVLFGDSRIEAWDSPPPVEGVEFVNRGWGNEATGQAVLPARAPRDRAAAGDGGHPVRHQRPQGNRAIPRCDEEIVLGCRRNLESMVARLRRGSASCC